MSLDTNQDKRQSFWTEYQPGLRATGEPVGSRHFFHQIEERRYALEPDIPELAQFSSWAGRDVLDAGCGMATDGAQFARAGANYTGIDFSPTALELARKRFSMEGLTGNFVEGSIAELPFDDASFDLVYSMGVIHHIPNTEQVVSEFHRVLRPGGRAIVMVYHRDSLNYRVSILLLRRALIMLLLVPGGVDIVRRLTGEPLDVLNTHRELLREHGLGYPRDKQLFLDNNTDGPGNPLSKVYSRHEAGHLFGQFADVQSAVRFLHLRSYPGGDRLTRTRLAELMGARWGWHLWILARKGLSTRGPAPRRNIGGQG